MSQSKNYNNGKQRRQLFLILKVMMVVTVVEFVIFMSEVLMMARVEKLPFFKSLYFSIVTIFTVGYGDIAPKTTMGQMIDIITIVTGVGYIGFITSLLIFVLVEGEAIQAWSEKMTEFKISHMKNHIIVCGLGRAGSSAVRQLVKNNKPFVGIDPDESKSESIKQDGHPILNGDATEDIILEKAGIRNASAIIAALPEDADNMLIAMAAKDLNPNIRVVTRANRKENEKRLLRAQADWVIPVGFTGGSHLAMAAIKPATIGFMQKVLDWNDLDLHIEEFYIEECCELANKSLSELNLRQNYGVQLLAIIRNGHTIHATPEVKLRPMDIIITFGPAEGISRMTKCFGVSCPLELSSKIEQN